MGGGSIDGLVLLQQLPYAAERVSTVLGCAEKRGLREHHEWRIQQFYEERFKLYLAETLKEVFTKQEPHPLLWRFKHFYLRCLSDINGHDERVYK